MLVRADETRFTDAKSLGAGDFLIGAQAGTTNFYTALEVTGTDDKNPSPRIKLFDTFGATVQALKAGDVDAVFMDNASAAGYMGASPNAFKIAGDPIGHDEFGFIFKKGSDLVAPGQRGDQVDEGRRHARRAQQEVVLRLQQPAVTRGRHERGL